MKAAALRIALAIPLIGVSVLATLPATTLDGALAAASDGRLRLLAAQGSLWRGQGLLAGVAHGSHVSRPWLAATWEVDFGELARGGIAWRVSTGKGQVLRLRLSPAGVEISGVSIDAPLDALLVPLSHGLARAGWRGWLQVTSPAWGCDWQGQCRGEARIRWSGATVDLLPGQRFGDYEAIIKGVDGGGEFGVRTLAGQLAISARGGWQNGGRPHFRGEIHGQPIVIGSLPSIMNGIASPTANPSRARIELR